MNNLKPRVVLSLFFISGYTALVFEVVWGKQACLIFGSSTMAFAAVIAAYMTGLAIGSYLFGKIADKNPNASFFLYGVLEGGIGLFAIGFPLFLYFLTPVYKSIYLAYFEHFLRISVIRFGLSFLVLMIPTTLMGGTLPLLSRFLSKSPESMKENISKLYAMNLFGAMAGSFCSGFFLIGGLGLYLSSVSAAVLNLGIFLCVMFYRKRFEEAAYRTPDIKGPLQPELSEESGDLLTKKIVALVIGLMAIHGFNAFVIQICWTRTVALVLGASAYSFSAMLTTFLAGLGLGTWAVAGIAKKKIKLSLSDIGLMEIAVGASVLVFIPVFEWLIYFFVRIFPFIESSIFLVFTTQFVFCVIAMVVPTFLMGLIFPSALYYLGRPKDIGRIVGTTYAVNTLGGVLGCFLAAFYFVGHFGLNGSMRFIGALSMLAGFVVVALSSNKAKLWLNLGKSLIMNSSTEERQI